MADQPYRPSNSTEGYAFIARWCANCAHSKHWRDREACEGCDITFRTMLHKRDDPEYPKEWIGPWNDPRCTAFEQYVAPPPRKRKPARDKTMPDMFGGNGNG